MSQTTVSQSQMLTDLGAEVGHRHVLTAAEARAKYGENLTGVFRRLTGAVTTTSVTDVQRVVDIARRCERRASDVTCCKGDSQ